MENAKPLVIVLSRNYSTGLGIIRSLGKAGYTIDLIASTKKKGSSAIASCSKYVRNSVEVVTPDIQVDTGAGLIKKIMEYVKNCDEKMVLFPVDDFTTSVVDNNRHLLKEFFFMPGISENSSGSVTQMMNKKKQSEMAKNAGLLIPAEWIVSLRDDLALSDDVVYPCFVKPIQSISGHKTEMKICYNKKELERHLLELKKNNKNREVLVQQFLNIDKEYDLSGVCLDQNIIIPGIIEKSRIAEYEVGVTMSGKMLPTDVLQDVKDKVMDFLKSIHYVGMFDMELFQCGNKVYFNEINFRSGGPNYFYHQCGVNLPEIFVKEILGHGHQVEEEFIREFGKTFVYEKVAWEDYIHSFMTKDELKKCLKKANFTLLDDKEDPAPGKLFNKRIRLSNMKFKLKNNMLKQKKSDGSSEVCSDRPRVVVAGRNYCNILTMTRALGEAGYDVDVLRAYKKKPGRINILGRMEPDARSQYVKSFQRCVVNEHPERLIKTLIRLAKQSEKQLLLPVDDYTACIVDETLDQLKEYYIVPNVADTAGEISRLMDKNEQKRLALKHHLPMAHSVLVKSENGVFDIPEEIHYPCFIKPNISKNSTKAKMMRCDDKKTLEQVLLRFAKQEDFEMLVEDFVDIKDEYSVLGVSVKGKVIAPAVFRVLEGGHKERKGVTITGEAVDLEPFGDILDKCCKYIESLQYEGLFDIDLLESKDGEIYFIELNFRAGASTHLFTKTGLNLPGMFADYMLKNQNIENVCAHESIGKKFVSEKVLLEEYVRNDANVFQVMRYVLGADVTFIRDDRDEMPYKYFKKYFLIANGLKLLYWIRDNLMNKK